MELLERERSGTSILGTATSRAAAPIMMRARAASVRLPEEEAAWRRVCEAGASARGLPPQQQYSPGPPSRPAIPMEGPGHGTQHRRP
jgi:hypothetical protein